MSTYVLLIATIIFMAVAVGLTLKIGSSMGGKDSGNGAAYSANTGRKLGRLLAFYGVAIVAVLAFFIAVMRG